MNIDDILNYREPTLAGKKALVTGASAGFGQAIACRLAAEGCHLVLLARREKPLAQLAQVLGTRFPHLTIATVVGDVRDATLVDRLKAQGHLDVDILVNNAGLAKGLDAVETADLSHWQEMIDTNVTAVFRMTHAVLPRMIARGGGHIVNLGSIASHEAYDKGSVYCATKHALLAFSKALRQEVCGKNIRVSVVSPGMAKTEFSLVRFSGDATKADAVYQGVDALNAADVAHEIIFCLKQPPHVNIDEILVMPTQQGSVKVLARRS